MKKNILTLVLLLTGMAFAGNFVIFAAPGDTTVTSTIENGTTNSPYRIKSDGLGAYLNGTSSVVSIIQGIGDWELNTKSSKTRKVFFDFRDPVTTSTQTPNAPFQTALTPTRFISKCTQVGIKLQDLMLNQTVLCPLAISLDYGGATYAVRMNPTNYAETDWVQWTCTSAVSGKCNGWLLEPSVVQSNGERKVKGQLLKISTTKGQTVETPRGVFYFSFRMTLTNP